MAEGRTAHPRRPDIVQDRFEEPVFVPAIFDKLMRAGEGKILRQLKAISDQVNSVEAEFEALSDAELRAQTDEFK